MMTIDAATLVVVGDDETTPVHGDDVRAEQRENDGYNREKRAHGIGIDRLLFTRRRLSRLTTPSSATAERGAACAGRAKRGGLKHRP